MGDVPLGGSEMKLGDVLGARTAELQPKEVGQQLVVAERRARRVDRDDEHVVVLEREKEALRPGGADEMVGQGPRNAVEDRRPQEQPAHVDGLAGEHFLKQVVGDGPLIARELGDEASRIRMAGEGERGQTQACGPALGATMELRQTFVVETDMHRLEHGARLGQVEPQIGLANLRELTGQAQSVEPELRVVARREHDAELLGARLDEFGNILESGDGVEFLEVVDHQQDRPIEPGELGDEPMRAPEPSNSGDGASGAMTVSDPTAARSCSSIESQKRWGSCSSRRTETQAAQSLRFASSIQECRRTVLPLPGGAETSVTPPANPADRRSNRSGLANGRTVGTRGHRGSPHLVHRLTPVSPTSPNYRGRRDRALLSPPRS